MPSIEAKVCPWNVPNSYGEIIAKGAFDKFFSRQKFVPMKIMHEGEPVGSWLKFEDRGDALWARGEIIKPAPLHMLPEISICFQDFGAVRTFTARRMRDFEIAQGWAPWGLVRVVDQHVTRDAGLSEISLVQSGAFEGTHYRVH